MKTQPEEIEVGVRHNGVHLPCVVKMGVRPSVYAHIGGRVTKQSHPEQYAKAVELATREQRARDFERKAEMTCADPSPQPAVRSTSR